MGIPLVCNAGVGDTDFIVKKYGSGSVIEAFDHSHYLEEIRLQQPFNPDQLTQGASDYFSLEKGIESYRNIYCLLEKNG